MSISIIMKCLTNFRAKSGLSINQLKSNFFSTGIFGSDFAIIQKLTGFSSGSMPFRYLGILLTTEKLRISHYDALTDKLAGYINGWRSSPMPYAGKAELIRSIL